MYMEQLKEHHKKLWALVRSLQNYKTGEDGRRNARETSSVISKMSGILNVHLASEDKYLYPALQKNTDPAIRQTAVRFSNEMGSLSTVYASYRNRFMLTSQIEADPDGFLQETTKILAALIARFQKEDNELYPLIRD